MLSRSQAKWFFLVATFLSSAAFIALTIHSFSTLPRRTNTAEMTPLVVQGKHLWDESNCMGCHTLLGEGGYYAPELTRVYERRGPAFIRSMLRDPQAMYPGQRKMVKYNFTDQQIEAMVAFLQWIGGMDLNGFPPKPTLFAMATPGGDAVTVRDNRPQIFNQMCIACHSLGGQGGNVGPALDGVGDRKTQSEIETWLTDPLAVKPDTKMPKLPLSGADISELGAFLTTLRGTPGPGGDAPVGTVDAPTQGPDTPPLPEAPPTNPAHPLAPKATP
jgi:nitric oxide reductase subunit C